MRKDEMHGKEEPIRDTLLTRREAIGLAASAASVPLAGCLRPVPADNAAIGDKRTVRILATSDLHGKMLPWNYPADEADASGSMAHLAYAVADILDYHTRLVD